MPPNLGHSLLQVRIASSRSGNFPCRIVARRRYPSNTHRFFHPSTRWRAASNPSDGRPPIQDKGAVQKPPDDNGQALEEQKDAGLKFYGSARRRAMRNRRALFAEEPIPVSLPKRFLEEKVLLLSENNPEEIVRTTASSDEAVASTMESESADQATQPGPDSQEKVTGTEDYHQQRLAYEDLADVWNELDMSIKAGLTPPRQEYRDAVAADKSHLVLNSISENGQYHIYSGLKRLAQKNSADLVTIDALDIAEVASCHHYGEPDLKSLRYLGFDVYREYGDISEDSLSTFVMDQGQEDNGDFEGESFPPSSGRNFQISTKVVPLDLTEALTPLLNKWGINKNKSDQPQGLFPSDIEEEETYRKQKDLKIWNAMIGQFLRAPAEKTSIKGQSSGDPKSSDRLIIFIHDIMKIYEHKNGQKFLANIERVVQEKRRAGQSILMVGSMSTKFENAARPRFDGFQGLDDEGIWRMVMVPPVLRDVHARAVLFEDKKRWYREINERQLVQMLRQKKNPQLTAAVNGQIFDMELPKDEHVPILVAKLKMLDKYWSFDQVHRMVTFIAGNDSSDPDQPFKAAEIRQALKQMIRSDGSRIAWFDEERKIAHEKAPRLLEAPQDDKMKQLLRKCNKHERKLLSGVVEPAKIRTTFKDVHAPVETIDAIKTLTTLSLIRPDAFSYGVLASDKIPGLLLYGPPGTGKTLLAKAVAKEAGSSMLEISGAEIYDMYVGEGEKNIKAVFSLAKKLTPCIIFIDEADAIFSSRTQSRQRTSHREMINQFLKEWDGMSNDSGGAFLMVATNRPFDLDDAVLRRLPRRLLVDLPGEQDRLEILHIHLKDEVSASDVNLPLLASKTAFYSGSDLKNLAVAAALNCVREENEVAQQHNASSSSSTSESQEYDPKRQQQPDPYIYPARRTLHQRHFDKAVEEITASISEDMDSLKQIKKFDEQYGDRLGGRKKKRNQWGFRTPGEADRALETVKVRG